MIMCEDCRYWDTSSQLALEDPDSTGRCIRHAPFVDMRTGQGVWPHTEDSDRCGEGEPIEKDPEAPSYELRHKRHGCYNIIDKSGTTIVGDIKGHAFAVDIFGQIRDGQLSIGDALRRVLAQQEASSRLPIG